MTQKTIEATANNELIDACQKGDTEKVRLLLQDGASPDTREALWGWSVFNRAVDKGYKDIVNILLQYGAECSKKDIKLAKRRGWPEIAELLNRHLLEKEKNRQDQLISDSSKGSQPSAVSQIKGVSTKERTVGEIFAVSIVLFLIGVLLSQAVEMPVGVMIIGAVALAVLGNIIIFLVDRRRLERPEQPSATHSVEPARETRESGPTKTSEASDVDTVPKAESTFRLVDAFVGLGVVCLIIIVLLGGEPIHAKIIAVVVLSALAGSIFYGVSWRVDELTSPGTGSGSPKAEPSDTLSMGGDMANRGLSVVEKEILADIRAGMTDSELMNKNHVSETTLEAIFMQLVAADVLKQAELDIRKAVLQRGNLHPEPVPQSETSEGKVSRPNQAISTEQSAATYSVKASPETQEQEFLKAAVPEIRKNNYALAVLILGVVSVFLYTIGILPILAIVFSSIGLSKVKPYGGKGQIQAAIGLVLGIIYTLLYMKAYGYLG